uniref:General transcription factor IIIC, polypeptide 3 n=1 Tax=Hucho hucho TaxID=62062 RepID=A0A4W5R2H7_9TELE
MSGFSSELIDYLEGRISFEEFEIRREERKAKLKVSGTSALHAVLSVKRSNVCTSFGARKDIICATGTPFTNACVESISSRISSLRYRTKEEEEEEDAEEERKVEAKGDEEEGPSAGDVFALEMEPVVILLPRALRGLMGEANIRYARGDKEDAVLMCMEIIRQEEVRKVVVPDHVPVDIRVKLMVCLIHQHVYRPLDSMLTSLMEQSPEDLGDLYLDVAEAFLDEGEYNSALPLLSALVCSERYNLAVVWLRHAECLKALGHMEVAVKSYSKVVQMAPLHLEARLCLSTLQQQLGRPLCALKALEPMYDPDTLAQDASAAQQELKLLLHRSTLLRSQGRLDDYLDTMLTMLAMLLKVDTPLHSLLPQGSQLPSSNTTGNTTDTPHLFLISLLQGIEADQVDLRREIAFNLSIIYQASGNTEMVRHLINTYCTV